MRRLLVLSLCASICTTTMLSAMSFSQFKKRVIRESKILKRSRLSLLATDEESKIAMRSANPTMELEMSQFRPDIGDDRGGFRASYAQPIRTSGYYDSLSQHTSAQKLLQKAYIVEGRAGFIKKIEKLYVDLVYRDQLYRLLEGDLKISKRVADIVKERFESGAESRVQYMQAKTEVISSKSKLISLKREIDDIYFDMMKISGLGADVKLDMSFTYPISAENSNQKSNSPLAEILSAKEHRYSTDVHMQDRVLKQYSLFTELEKEPDQSVIRIGIEIDLPIFNQNNEERSLAKIRMRQARLDREQLQNSEDVERRAILNSMKTLTKEYYMLKDLAKEQREVLELLEEGYRISKGSLLELMVARKRVIDTNKKILYTHRVYNMKKIDLNYLQGVYND